MTSLILVEQSKENLSHVEFAELVVGIISLGRTDAIQHTTATVDEGLRQFFPDRPSVIINCSNGSPDPTREAFLQVPTETPKIYLSTPEGVFGKGHKLLSILQKCLELRADRIVVLDAEEQGVTPRWIRNLAEPLLNNYQFVAPVYSRHQNGSIISSSIVYPMTRCLYGRRVREPMGQNFAISQQLTRMILDKPWGDYATGLGGNTWIATHAITSGLPICQSFLPGPRDQRVEDYSSHHQMVLYDNCGVLFSLMEKHSNDWKDVRWSQPIPTFGLDEAPITVPPETTPPVPYLFEKFKEGFLHFGGTWEKILHQDVLMKIREIQELSLESFEFPDLLWALTLYDYATAFCRGPGSRKTCLESLLPLYFGRVCSEACVTADMDIRRVEVHIEEQCRVFEETKPWLTRLWN